MTIKQKSSTLNNLKQQIGRYLVSNIANQSILVGELNDEELVQFCLYANQTYRAGQAIISDEDYDFIYLPALNACNPKHPLLSQVEPEIEGFSQTKYKLPQVMLSTDKAYSWQEVDKWLTRIKKSAQLINLAVCDIEIEITAKLDGFAGFDDGKRLYTRGDGKKGSDISRVFERGLSVFKDSGRGLGAGEIVVKKSYFEKNLAQNFESPRNFQASIIKEKSLDVPTQNAINDKAALFVPFSTLPSWVGRIDELSQQFNTAVADILHGVDFEVDGVVLSTINAELRSEMGSTRKFHRWQLAFKQNKDKAQVKVLNVTPQVGRTGKITPVVELEPTLLSGATLSRASAHHYGFIKQQNLGINSIIELTRSGLVIPKINKVLRATQAVIPDYCPSCTHDLVWQSDFLMCLNHQACEAQAIAGLDFFFATLGNNDGFGRATIDKLYRHGVQTLIKIYQLDKPQLTTIGFGDKTSDNLLLELAKSKKTAIEDWRFLAAFGISRLGLGNCERLLQSYPLEKLWELSVADIADIEGFAQLSAQAIVKGLLLIKPNFDWLYQQRFNLETTPLLVGHSMQIEVQKNAQTNASFFGQSIVFTGKMQMSRQEMGKHAKSLGMKVLASVSKQCDYLVTGEKVGQSKLNKATALGVEILSEQQYLDKINKA